MLIDDFLASSPTETADVVAGIAAVHVEEGQGDDAIALVDRALTFMPDDGLLLARGFLLERLDRVPEALADLRKVAERRPNDPMAQNALGYTLVDRTRSFEEGQRLIEQALAAKPDSYAIQDSMGWALVQMGRLEDGRAWLDKAWKRSEDPEVAAHLGETLWRMGQEDEARQSLGRGARGQSGQPAAQARDRAPSEVKLRVAAVAVALLAGGCATTPPQVQTEDWPERRAALQALDDWNLDGRVAVAAGDDGFSGGLNWEQRGEKAEITLRGPMGGAAILIRVDGAQTVVTDERGVTYDGEEARRFIEQNLGPGITTTDRGDALLARRRAGARFAS